MSSSATAAENHYSLLGLAVGATLDEIREGKRRALLRWHPDKHEDKQLACIMFPKVKLAADVRGYTRNECSDSF